MKHINNYLFEKLVLNKNIKSIVDLDNLIKQDETLYEYDDEDDDISWSVCESVFKKIDQNYDGFIAFKYKSIMKSKEIADKKNQDIEPWMVEERFDEIQDKIINGKDYGYSVYLKGGHVEIDAINSGSSCPFYIYALTRVGYDEVSAYWEGVEEVPNLNFLFDDHDHKYLIPIELD